MADLLPVGAYVRVEEKGTDARTYIAKVVGYDMWGTKYQLGARFGGWGKPRFADGGYWAFPTWCTEISEAEATAVPEES